MDFINCDIQYAPSDRIIFYDDTSRNKSSLDEWIEGKQKAQYDSELFHTAFPYIVVAFPGVELQFINITSKNHAAIYKCKDHDMVAMRLDEGGLINAVGGRHAPFDDGTYQVDAILCRKLKDNEDEVLQVLNKKNIEYESIALLMELGLNSNEANLLFYLQKSGEKDPRNIVRYTPQFVNITRLESHRDEDVILAALESLVAKALVHIFSVALRGGAKYHPAMESLYTPNSGLWRLDNELSHEQKEEKIAQLFELWKKYCGSDNR